MAWQFVGQHTFVPTDKEVQIGSFDLASGQDTIWVRITQINEPADWPWSYGILSWRNSEGLPLGSVKAYSTRLGEVFRLGNGLAPLDGTGGIWFEPRGFNLGWLKAGFPWELAFEAQSGVTDMTSGYWNRDPVNGLITPKTDGDDLSLLSGHITSTNSTVSNQLRVDGSLLMPAGTTAKIDGSIDALQVPTFWGVVNGDGSFKNGFGFTSRLSSPSIYEITFNSPLSTDNYAVLVTANVNTITFMVAYGKTPLGFTVHAAELGSGGGLVGAFPEFSFTVFTP